MNTDQNPITGARLKSLRISRRVTLVDLCSQVGIDAGNYSRVERGVFAPPSRDRLTAILDALEVDAPEQESVLDQADLERGNLPSDLKDDAVLLKELPLLFRAVRNKDDNALDEFIEALREDADA